LASRATDPRPLRDDGVDRRAKDRPHHGDVRGHQERRAHADERAIASAIEQPADVEIGWI
jgi:hypothetical protein